MMLYTKVFRRGKNTGAAEIVPVCHFCPFALRPWESMEREETRDGKGNYREGKGAIGLNN